jgi:uncharacterized protein (TIGR03083 family)
VQLTPRYHAPPIIEIDGPPGDTLAAVVRQRRRLEKLVSGFDDDQWLTASRCEDWNAREVIAHLVTVNMFWQASLQAGLAGTPTTMLADFDPSATPPLLIAGMASMSPAELVDQFVASNDGFLGLLDRLDDAGWATLAEAPPGHVPIHILNLHALWDSWVHERDIALPLGLTPEVEPDEVAHCLRYAAALGPAFAISSGVVDEGAFVVAAVDPDVAFVVRIGDDVVVVGDGEPPAGAPCLQGDAVTLVEALTMRVPLPPSTPESWSRLAGRLATVFDVEVGSTAL